MTALHKKGTNRRRSCNLDIQWLTSHFACKAGNEQIVKLYLNKNNDINAKIFYNTIIKGHYKDKDKKNRTVDSEQYKYV